MKRQSAYKYKGNDLANKLQTIQVSTKLKLLLEIGTNRDVIHKEQTTSISTNKESMQNKTYWDRYKRE